MENGKPDTDKGDVHTMKKRTVYTLSVLLLVVVFCALIPAAYAEDCVCTCTPGRDHACTGSCGTELELMRKSALSDFLMYTMAAEAETDPAAQTALYREVVKCWDNYMDIVLQSFGTALAAFISCRKRKKRLRWQTMTMQPSSLCFQKLLQRMLIRKN